MIQLVVFDWDGTLMDSALKITRCIQAAARDVQLEVPSFERAKWVIGLGLEEAMLRLFPTATQQQLASMVTAYKHHFVSNDTTEQPLFESVYEGLQMLDQQGVLLAVATGKSRAGLSRVFDQLGWHGLFVTTRCADESRTKPHPQMLLDILDYTGLEAEQALMVGDTTFDMEMAENAKMRGLAVSYGVHDADQLRASPALAVVDSFTAVLDWVQHNNSSLGVAL